MNAAFLVRRTGQHDRVDRYHGCALEEFHHRRSKTRAVDHHDIQVLRNRHLDPVEGRFLPGRRRPELFRRKKFAEVFRGFVRERPAGFTFGVFFNVAHQVEQIAGNLVDAVAVAADFLTGKFDARAGRHRRSERHDVFQRPGKVGRGTRDKARASCQGIVDGFLRRQQRALGFFLQVDVRVRNDEIPVGGLSDRPDEPVAAFYRNFLCAEIGRRRNEVGEVVLVIGICDQALACFGENRKSMPGRFKRLFQQVVRALGFGPGFNQFQGRLEEVPGADEQGDREGEAEKRRRHCRCGVVLEKGQQQHDGCGSHVPRRYAHHGGGKADDAAAHAHGDADHGQLLCIGFRHRGQHQSRPPEAEDEGSDFGPFHEPAGRHAPGAEVERTQTTPEHEDGIERDRQPPEKGNRTEAGRGVRRKHGEQDRRINQRHYTDRNFVFLEPAQHVQVHRSAHALIDLR